MKANLQTSSHVFHKSEIFVLCLSLRDRPIISNFGYGKQDLVYIL